MHAITPARGLFGRVPSFADLPPWSLNAPTSLTSFVEFTMSDATNHARAAGHMTYHYKWAHTL